MKLTAMSRAYITRNINRKADARRAELSAEIAKISKVHEEKIAKAREIAERAIRGLLPKLVREFKAIGLTWLDHEYEKCSGELVLRDSENTIAPVCIDSDDFAETASTSKYISAGDRRGYRTVTVWANERLSELQRALDEVDERRDEAIEKVIFSIETSKEDAVSIEKILADITF